MLCSISTMTRSRHDWRYSPFGFFEVIWKSLRNRGIPQRLGLCIPKGVVTVQVHCVQASEVILETILDHATIPERSIMSASCDFLPAPKEQSRH